MVNGAFHGIKPFFVPLHDGVKPYTGITIVSALRPLCLVRLG
jgi:hypothetical protein